MSEQVAGSGLYERAEHAARIIRARMKVEPRICVVLGSGLGAFADEFQETVSIPYQEIPGFGRSTAEGHAGQLVIGKVDQVPLLAMKGRLHYYEGYSLEEVTFPIRAFKLLGLKTIILTNASGGINVQLSPGTLMVITDHLNLMSANPLRGPNDERFGPRFPDMSAVYSPELQEIVMEEAREIQLDVRRGIYAALAGPSYETPAEIHLMRNFGADAVGMSTVPEAIVARHMDLEVLGISCITNLAAGVSDEPINHEDVMATGLRVGATFSQLLKRVVVRLNARV
ncbi:MAG TPA: purine-nucleoside phosphorylase [Pyrinomonadaceae bacterium]|nr:purine-nucleoside phosphorylase [Pyrinomonadaceae bacterium]